MMIENFFLRYAYPCAYIILQRKEITQHELDELENIAINNLPISKERLEKIFYKAFEFIDLLAEEQGKERWDPEIIREYFYSYHNKMIDKGIGIYATAPPMLKELSRVDKVKVTAKKDDVLTVEFLGNDKKIRKRNVLNHFVPDAEEGSTITIHYGYAVELLGR
jgi:hypothetical protein